MIANSAPDENAFRRAGLINGLSAYLLWGLIPLLFAAATPTGALELVSHRVVWSLLFCAVLLVFTGGFARTWQVVRSGRTFWMLTLAAVLIAINWTAFIYGVETGHLVEVSLGYYLNPLISIGLGVIFLGEKLRPLQWTAAGFGLIAVIIVGLGLGRMPYLSFTVAISFGLYGLVKNKVGNQVGALEGMTIESAVLAIPSAAYLLILGAMGLSTFTGLGAGHVIIILITGPATAIPLILFSAAARRIPLSWVGMLQYITPTMQFITGVYILGESMSMTRWVGFFVIWIAVLLLCTDLIRQSRRRL
ncbi:EamA family transporter RarD [Brevibacterium aurantiacum]|uniref:Protein RarD n=1 Tax=Brevibacterium aurantiacum TaxID=273384 RepID=A0A2A3ZPQ4_BREAU|nr:EamA family transporter RarD [Brevibacterium aurantiacum]MDN5549633.1 EamA family transporter RarD [Brevibacterium sp.]AZT92676.1 EamA family transporter RarD [Brevibacterium aurantiacum]PCC50470.1 protein RarD [Brevibacterium aurantiacum]PCC53559.1 protein RarD [Brevibacterium aurantiacum]SMY00268.1 chloramphenicol-sensitive protein RarD [Brevibacterium aurantiacum]